ncbi:MAG: 23S rRNA (pseudouridine(1915)-N(3))-methyltransferase RlmH [Patescibacteria group bacterium]
MRISIIAVGAIKEAYWTDAIGEYLKRLKPFARVDIREVSAAHFRSKREGKNALMQESERLLSVVPKQCFGIALDLHGKRYDSEEFARELQAWTSAGQHLAFFIGGPLGLSGEVQKRAHAKLSLSSLTFTHQMARVILLEQIYRAITIQKGKTYHY